MDPEDDHRNHGCYHDTVDKNTGVLAVRATPNGIAAMAEWRIRLAVGQKDEQDQTTFNDLLDGNGGADTLVGGSGNDTFVVDAVGVAIVELARICPSPSPCSFCPDCPYSFYPGSPCAAADCSIHKHSTNIFPISVAVRHPAASERCVPFCLCRCRGGGDEACSVPSMDAVVAFWAILSLTPF
jgi:hypothetical protein